MHMPYIQVAFGGDTDTTASMVGGILGARHGTAWVPRRWYDHVEASGRARVEVAGRALGALALGPEDIVWPV